MHRGLAVLFFLEEEGVSPYGGLTTVGKRSFCKCTDRGTPQIISQVSIHRRTTKWWLWDHLRSTDKTCTCSTKHQEWVMPSNTVLREFSVCLILCICILLETRKSGNIYCLEVEPCAVSDTARPHRYFLFNSWILLSIRNTISSSSSM